MSKSRLPPPRPKPCVTLIGPEKFTLPDYFLWALVGFFAILTALMLSVPSIFAQEPSPVLLDRKEASWVEVWLDEPFLFKYPHWTGWVWSEDKTQDPYVAKHKASIYAIACGRWEKVIDEERPQGYIWGLDLTWDPPADGGCAGGTWLSSGIYIYAVPWIDEPTVMPTEPPTSEPIDTPVPTEEPTPGETPVWVPRTWTVYCGGVGTTGQIIWHIDNRQDQMVVSVPWSWCEQAWLDGPVKLLERIGDQSP